MGDALPLTVNRLALTMLQSVEAVLIPAMMKLYYLAEGEAMEIYGIITGMAMPFITFPSTLTGSLASMLLPTVAEAVGRGDYSLVKRAVSKSLHYCLIIGILSMSIFGLYGNGLARFSLIIRRRDRYWPLLPCCVPFCTHPLHWPVC